MARTRITQSMRTAFGTGKGGALYSALYFLYYGAGASWNPFFNLYLRQIGLSGIDIGTLASVRPAVTLIGQPIAGLIADSWGRRRSLIVVMVLSAALLPVFASNTTLLFLAIWVGVYAFLTAPAGTLIDSLVLDHIDRQPGRSFAQFRLWGAIGWGIMAYIVGRLMNGRDLRWTFVIASIILGIGVIIALRLPRYDGAGAVTTRTLRGAGTLLRNKQLLLFLVLVALLQSGAAAVFSFVPVYLDEIGASRGMVGLAIGLQGLGELPLYLLAATIIRRIGPHRTIVLAITVFGVRSLAYSIITVPALAAAVELLHGLSFSLFLVSSVQYVDQLVPSEWRATGQSLLSTAYFGLGGIIGNLWSGFLLDRIGVQPMFRINSYFLLGLAVVALFVLKPSKAANATPT